jgi:hypothetical protein
VRRTLTVGYSDPSALDATSIRLDHSLTRKITLIARYNHAPSHDATRNWEEVLHDNANIDTFTAGVTILLAPTRVNDFRTNWSRNIGSLVNSLTNFHGAVVPSGQFQRRISHGLQALVSFKFRKIKRSRFQWHAQRGKTHVDVESRHRPGGKHRENKPDKHTA